MALPLTHQNAVGGGGLSGEGRQPPKSGGSHSALGPAAFLLMMYLHEGILEIPSLLKNEIIRHFLWPRGAMKSSGVAIYSVAA